MTEEGHSIPPWFIPDGEYRIGEESDTRIETVSGEDVSDQFTERQKHAIGNHHKIFGYHGIRRDGDGALACRQCNVTGSALERIKCPAMGYEDTHVTIDYE